MPEDAASYYPEPLDLTIEMEVEASADSILRAAPRPTEPAPVPIAEPAPAPAPVAVPRRRSAHGKATPPAPPAATPGSVAAAMFLQLRSECEELRRRMAMVPRATQTAAIQIAELEKALLSIRRARDNTLTQMQEQAQKLKEAEQRNEELLIEQDALQHTADVTAAALEATRLESDELRDLLHAKDEDHAAAMREMEARTEEAQQLPMSASTQKLMHAQLATARDRIAALESCFQASQLQHKESVATILENLLRTERAQGEAEELSRHLEGQLQDVVTERNQYYEALLAAHAQIEEFQAGSVRGNENADVAWQLEQQRQQIAELSEQLDAARDEVRLAWSVNRTAEPVEPEPEPELVEEAVSEPFADQEARLLVADMEQTYLLAAGAQNPVEMLGVLGAQVKEFAQRMLGTGSMASYRVLGVCTEVIEWMQKTPGKVATMQETMVEAFRLLAQVVECPEPAVHGDTMEASVYVVDDDLDNCDCIAMSLDRIGLRTRYASKPELAVEHLIAESADLIFLDVDLGSTNGFAVHARLRQMPHHRRTPVLFVSGMSSARVQVASLGRDEDAFLQKPYTLSELRLKALCMIIAARLSVVAAEATS